MQQTSIVKRSGTVEQFYEEKLVRSLLRSGARQDLIHKVVEEIKREIKKNDLTTTDAIYRRAFKLLRKESRMIASRYHLRRAIMELGPSGHPFEKLIAGVLATQGYTTRVSVVVQGMCVSHEVDVVAEKEGKRIMIECKFHNQQEIKSDIKTSLYVHARFDDIKKFEQNERFDEVWLVTNTKLTGDAIQYAQCVGMKAIGWSYPEIGNVQDLVETSGLYPVTSLHSLNRGQKQYLLERGVIFCKDIVNDPSVLRGFNFSKIKYEVVIKEAQGFLSFLSR